MLLFADAERTLSLSFLSLFLSLCQSISHTHMFSLSFSFSIYLFLSSSLLFSYTFQTRNDANLTVFFKLDVHAELLEIWKKKSYIEYEYRTSKLRVTCPIHSCQTHFTHTSRFFQITIFIHRTPQYDEYNILHLIRKMKVLWAVDK